MTKIKIKTTSWNNLAGSKCKLAWGIHFWRHNGKWQLIFPLRKFNVGRKCLYFKVMKGY